VIVNELEELFPQLIGRPGLYFGVPSLARFRAFLDGWCMGKGIRLRDSTVFAGFPEWLAERLDFNDPQSLSWEGMIRAYSMDDRSGFESFVTHYNEFRRQHPLAKSSVPSS
jgi:hypothetical protein